MIATSKNDAAVTKNEVPYFVRLLITSFPRARMSPYDYYATVSFFEEPQRDPANPEYGIHGSKSWRDIVSLADIKSVTSAKNQATADSIALRDQVSSFLRHSQCGGNSSKEFVASRVVSSRAQRARKRLPCNSITFCDPAR